MATLKTTLSFVVRFVQAIIAHVQTQIQTDHDKIQHIEEQYVPFGRKGSHICLVDQLGNNAGYVTEDNQAQKAETFSLSRPCSVRLIHIYRPRGTETDDHNNFK